MSPLLEEMPDRAEEYSVPLEKGDAERAGGYIILDITPKTRPATRRSPILDLCGNVSHDWQYDLWMTPPALRATSSVKEALRNVSSFRGDARQGRGVVLSKETIGSIFSPPQCLSLH